MAITARFIPGTGVLTVQGDSLDNTITIAPDPAGTILVNDGAVTVDGGQPTTSVTSLIQVLGRDGNDVITFDETNGVLPDAIISGGGGDDTINSGGGNDQIFGDAGNDMISGGGGSDVLAGGAGDDDVSGGSGNDRIVWNSGDGNDTAGGGFGFDTLEVNGGDGAETFAITAHFRSVGVDIFDPAQSTISAGSIEAIVLNAGGGDDVITATNGLAASLTIDGGAGNDTINTGDGADVLMGGKGNDFVDGNGGNDSAFLGAGNDVFQWDPGDGSDLVEGQAGFDTLVFNGSAASEHIGIALSGADRVLFSRDVGGITMDLHGIEHITFNGNGGSDTIVVGDLSGTDVSEVAIDLAGGGGQGGGHHGAHNLIDLSGGNGNSHVHVSVADGVVTVDGLAADVTIAHSDAADSLVIHAFAGNDTIDASPLTADLLALTVDGGAGNDKIMGGDGADVIDGGTGKDQLSGGGGGDHFVFDTTLGDNNVDTIADFTVSVDTMVLDHRIFDALPAGALSPDAFFTGKAAHDGSDRIVYDDKTGKLFYDADGNGGDAAVQFAKLDPHLDLGFGDFLIV